MASYSRSHVTADTLPELPAIAATKSGVEFDPRSDNWEFRDTLVDVSLAFGALLAVPELIAAAKGALLWFAENRSSSHMINMFYRLKHFLSTTSQENSRLSTISAADLMNYRGSLSKSHEWYFGVLRLLLLKWDGLGFPGLTPEAIEKLEEIRTRGNNKGDAVRLKDPYKGPLSVLETETLLDKLEHAFNNGMVTLREYTLVWLFCGLGYRPIQYAALKACDASVAISDDGSESFLLNVPRAKQQSLTRTKFKERNLVSEIGRCVLKCADDVKNRFEGILPDPGQGPLFPELNPPFCMQSGFEYHTTSQSLRNEFEEIVGRLSVHSERTQDQLHCTPARCRRTVGTRAAEEGYGPLAIAELLDHNDTQNVLCYIEATPEIIHRIDQAIADRMAPLANAFAGKIIAHSKSTRTSDPSSQIYDPAIAPPHSPMGCCGTHKACKKMAPYACYVCPLFRAFLNGPHQLMLDHLIAERERLKEVADLRIASINDRLIYAVAQVVAQCKQGRAGGANV